MKSTNRFLIILAIVILFTSNCSLPAYRIANYDVRILEPRNNQIVLLGSEITLEGYSYLTSAENRTTQFIFFANGSTIGTVAATPGSDASAKQARLRWTPTAAGEYQLQTEAIVSTPGDDRGGVSTSIKICVLDLSATGIRENVPGASEFFIANGYTGPCPIPPPAPTNPEDISFNFTVGPQAGFFAFPTDACPDTGIPVIRFTATINNDPSDSAALIIVDVSWGAGFGDTPIAISPIAPGPGGQKRYEGTWSPPDYYDGSNPITWTAYAFDRNGALLGTISDTIDMRPCTPGAPAGKPDDSTETPSPTATTTSMVPVSLIDFTLNKNAICRKGPGTQYEIAEYITEGDRIQAYARSEDSLWLVVVLKNKVRCWTAIQLGTPSDDINRLPVEAAPLILVIPSATGQADNSNDGGGGSCQAPTDCGQTEVYNGCNCVPLPPP